MIKVGTKKTSHGGFTGFVAIFSENRSENFPSKFLWSYSTRVIRTTKADALLDAKLEREFLRQSITNK